MLEITPPRSTNLQQRVVAPVASHNHISGGGRTRKLEKTTAYRLNPQIILSLLHTNQSTDARSKRFFMWAQLGPIRNTSLDREFVAQVGPVQTVHLFSWGQLGPMKIFLFYGAQLVPIKQV
jgi:hypothetical protein